jgi:hypothetical protein
VADDQKIQLLKKAIRNLQTAIDVLSEREREQLKDLIMKGQVSSEEELRGYLARLIAARARAREKERQRALERAAAARRTAEEEQGIVKKPDPEEATIERVAPPPGSPTGEAEGSADDPAKITGKVIDAKSRKPVPYARVRVQGTSFNEETESTGVFIWEELPRGRQVQFELSKKEYKSALVQYRATLDNEQHIVIKLVPVEKKETKKSASSGSGH